MRAYNWYEIASGERTGRFLAEAERDRLARLAAFPHRSLRARLAFVLRRLADRLEPGSRSLAPRELAPGS